MNPRLVGEGKGKAREGLGGRRRRSFGGGPLFSRTGRGSGGTLARVRRCTTGERAEDGGSGGIGRRCSSHGVSGSRTGLRKEVLIVSRY